MFVFYMGLPHLIVFHSIFSQTLSLSYYSGIRCCFGFGGGGGGGGGGVLGFGSSVAMVAGYACQNLGGSGGIWQIYLYRCQNLGGSGGIQQTRFTCIGDKI